METQPARSNPPAATASESRWPTVLGVIALVFGIGGALMYGFIGLVLPVLMGALGDSMSEMAETEPSLAPSVAQLGALRDHAGMLTLSSLLNAMASIILLVAGIGLLRRRRWSRTCSLVWAGVRAAVLIPSGVIGYRMNKAQFEAMQTAAADSPTPMPTSFYGMMESLTVVIVAFDALWKLALPVFFVIWLMRRKIRDEVEGW